MYKTLVLGKDEKWCLKCKQVLARGHFDFDIRAGGRGILTYCRNCQSTITGDQMKKSPLKSKTLWFNVLTIVAGLAAYLAGSEVIVENWAAMIPIMVAVQGAVNLALRFMTTKPII
jgi:uncharacterized membrane-anchored protein